MDSLPSTTLPGTMVSILIFLDSPATQCRYCGEKLIKWFQSLFSWTLLQLVTLYWSVGPIRILLVSILIFLDSPATKIISLISSKYSVFQSLFSWTLLQLYISFAWIAAKFSVSILIFLDSPATREILYQGRIQGTGPWVSILIFLDSPATRKYHHRYVT